MMGLNLTDVRENFIFNSFFKKIAALGEHFSQGAATVGRRTPVKTKKNTAGWLACRCLRYIHFTRGDVAVAVGVGRNTVYSPCSEGGCF